MALDFEARLEDTASLDYCGVSQLIADTTYLSYAYHYSATTSAASQVFWRQVNKSTLALGTERSVSGSKTSGAFNPELIQLTAGTYICAYSLGSQYAPAGWEAKESADGTTWASAKTVAGNQRIVGMCSDGTNVLIWTVEKAPTTTTPKVRCYKRTGAGAWTEIIAFTGTTSNRYFAYGGQAPGNNCYVNGEVALLVGPKMVSGLDEYVYCLRTANLSAGTPTWTETQIRHLAGEDWGHAAQLKRRNDVLRVMFDKQYNGNDVPGFAYSLDFGATWLAADNDTAFVGFDASGGPVEFDSVWNTGWAVDALGRSFLASPSWVGFLSQAGLNVWRSSNWDPGAWGTLEFAALIEDGDGDDLNVSQGTGCIFDGTTLYFAVTTWNGTDGGYQIWLLKDASIGGTAPKAPSGGGGARKLLPVDGDAGI